MMRSVCLWVPLIFILSLCATTKAYLPVPKPRWVTCGHRGFPLCFKQKVLCPFTCPFSCLMDCNSCKPVCSCNFPGAVCEDPRFVGGDGITFYFHGRKDQDFCLVSDTNLHINAHFIGKRNPKLKRDFTWVQSLGVLFNTHKVTVSAQKTAQWDDSNDRLAIFLGEAHISIPTGEGVQWRSPQEPSLTIRRTSKTNAIVVEVANNFRITANVVPITSQESKVHGYNITDEDCFAHLELGFKFYNLSDMVDGILGQTYRSNYVSKAKVNVPMPVMGGLEKYLSSSLFATNCGVSKFGNSVIQKASAEIEYPDLKCNSGMKGHGIVCKR